MTSRSSEEWGETQSNPDSYLRRSRPERAMSQSTRCFSHVLVLAMHMTWSRIESLRSCHHIHHLSLHPHLVHALDFELSFLFFGPKETISQGSGSGNNAT